MYKFEWDKETGGVILVNSSSLNLPSPRPVFYEELDLLGFDKYWEYPKTKEPLLWSIGRNYYYLGELVAKVKGGNIYEEPKIIITNSGQNLKIKPVDLRGMLEKNSAKLEALEAEAIEFIKSVYKDYREKVDYFVVSYSGGKDSQVVLDLVSKALPPEAYIVIFSDTTMEIPSTYETLENTRTYYTSLYPNLRFYVAESEIDSQESWKIFAPPTRVMRWCCSVHKTSPQVRLLRSLNPDKENLKILVFEGVRAEESMRRSTYNRIGEEVKHYTVINSRVILSWSSLEVYLHLLKLFAATNAWNLLNAGYRYGLSRVGCAVCPFASSWSEIIISRVFPLFTQKYLNVIKYYAGFVGVQNEGLKQYIAQGNWKKRASWKGINKDKNITFTESDSQILATLKTTNPIEELIEWLKPLGEVKMNGDKIIVSTSSRDSVLEFTIHKNHEEYAISVKDSENKKKQYNAAKKVLIKFAFCVKCATCEAECTTGALKVKPTVKIDVNKCVRCLNCLKVASKNLSIYDSCLLARARLR